MKSLNESIQEIFLNEAKNPYSYLRGTTFKKDGVEHKITKVEKISDDKYFIHSGDKIWNLITLIDNGIEFEKPKKIKRVAWNKGMKSMSKKEYQSIVKSAAETGGASNAYDLASSMILDKDIYDRLVKDNGRWPLSKLKQRLQWDIEAYA